MNDLHLALAAARAGVDVVSSRFGRAWATTYKGADNPVTEVDRASENAILSRIRKERPADSILAEEGGEGGDGSRRRWIVDPLDGTVNFMNGIPHVAVSVALYDGDEALVGVVADAVNGEVFTATRGRGAACDGTPIRVSDRADLGTAVVATGFPYDHKTHARAYTDWLAGVLAEVQGIRRFGAAALDFAWLAAGRFDGFYETGLGAWDVAAGALLVREAGGTVTTPDGSSFGPGQPTMVASNGLLHEALRRVVEAGLPAHLREGPG